MASHAPIILRQLFDRSSCTYTYLLVCSKTNEGVLIDPVIELTERDLEALTATKCNLKYVLNTHVHADHITGTGKLKAALSAESPQSVICKDSGAVADVYVGTGDTIRFGSRHLEVRQTPGHTPGCCTYVLDDQSAAFTGDTLLIRGCGRTDFQGGNPATLYDSVTTQIFSLPGSTVLWPGHDYMGRTWTTVDEEKAHNPRLGKERGKDAFVALMNDRFDGSKYPGNIDLALPANMVCGVFECGSFDDPTAKPVPHPGGFVWTPKTASSSAEGSAGQGEAKGAEGAASSPPLSQRVEGLVNLPNVVFIDLRNESADKLANLPLPGAIEIPSDRASAANNIRQAAETGLIPGDKTIPMLLYCRSGARAAVGIEELRKLGYSGPIVNGGGISELKSIFSNKLGKK